MKVTIIVGEVLSQDLQGETALSGKVCGLYDRYELLVEEKQFNLARATKRGT